MSRLFVVPPRRKFQEFRAGIVQVNVHVIGTAPLCDPKGLGRVVGLIVLADDSLCTLTSRFCLEPFLRIHL